MAMVFNTDGTFGKTIINGLKDMQKAVGGYIEVAMTMPPPMFADVAEGVHTLYVLVNEEGLLNGLPRNPFYSQWVGNVLIVDNLEMGE